MAEAHLRAAGVDESAWIGRRFRYTENLDGGMWASVITEVERRGGEWIVTRLDRSKEQAATPGFAEV
jgi:hypothetical protein